MSACNVTQDEVNLMWKWVLALRSGKYQQGSGVLRSEKNEFCCLGILCDISEKGSWTSEPINIEKGYGYTFGEAEFTIYPPNAIQRIFQKCYVQRTILVSMNDNRRLPFDAIADYIAENLKVAVPAEMLEEAKATVTL